MASKRQSSNDGLDERDTSKRRFQYTSDLGTGTGDKSNEGMTLEDQTGSSSGMGGYVGDMDALEGSLEPTGGASHYPHSLIREQDRFLPIANVSRIMKRVLPESGKVSKEAKECIQECVSEFISFITSEASERCLHEKRKTINGEDILWAMQTLGFDPYVEPLKMYLSKFRLASKGDKQTASAMATQNLVMIGGSSKQGRIDSNDNTNSSSVTITTTTASGGHGDGQIFLSQDDINNLLRSSAEQGQVQLTTGADGQLAIIEMGPESGVHTGQSREIGTTLTLPLISAGAGATADNAGQQYIITTLDQNTIDAGGMQQFAIPAGAQLAFIPPNSASGSAGSVGSAQGIPLVFLDSSGTTGHQQSPHYITVNASGADSSGHGVQILHMSSAGGLEGNGSTQVHGLTVSEGQ